MTIPDHYRKWAKKEAEREYPEVMGCGPCNYAKAEAYEAALLRMWPLVDALYLSTSAAASFGIEYHREDIACEPHIAENLRLSFRKTKEALSSLNLPQVSNG